MNILIPAAGNGSRFKDAGYKDPKPFIEVQDGLPMIDFVARNISEPGDGICSILRCDFGENEKVANHWIFQANRLIDEPTRGQAETVLIGLGKPPSGSLIVANCDQYIEYDRKAWRELISDPQIDGAIMTFESDSPICSYVGVKGRNVIRTAEKEVISNRATCGVYYFRDASLLKSAINLMMERDIKTNGEFYLCPVYNILIQEFGQNIVEFPVQKMYHMGTPETFEAACKELREKGVLA